MPRKTWIETTTRIRVSNTRLSLEYPLITFVAEIIQGMYSEWNADLGSVGRRDPDALPPQNLFQFIMFWIYSAVTALSRGNCLYALKAGLLTGMFQWK